MAALFWPVSLKRVHLRVFLLLVAFTTACSSPDSAPPAVSISAPAVGQAVSGNVQIQLSARDDSGIAKVSLYARGRGSTAEGVFIGSATSEPFVVSWATTGFPNQAELELYAKAEDNTGNFSQSDPVWVKTNNAGAPTFSYLLGYTLPPTLSATSRGVEGNGSKVESHSQAKSVWIPLLPDVPVRPPVGWTPETARASLQKLQSPISASDNSQNTPRRAFVLRFGWNAVQGANGYRIWQASGDIAGPYTNVRNQLAVGTGIQEYTPTLPNTKAGDIFYGAITASVNNSEGAYSNADSTLLLPAQVVTSPAPGSIAPKTPIFRWTATDGVQGYLWYVSRKPQDVATPSDWVCTNFPNSTDRLEVTYPSRCPELTPGAYHWWVAGVSFNAQVVVDAYTFSDSTPFAVQ